MIAIKSKQKNIVFYVYSLYILEGTIDLQIYDICTHPIYYIQFVL